MNEPERDPVAIGPTPPAPAQRALTARMVAVGVAALVASVLAPPLGALLGVLTLVQVARADRASGGLRALMGVVGGAAVVVGVAASIGAWLLRAEITSYRDCVQGANTRVAQQTCQDALDLALRERLGLAR